MSVNHVAISGNLTRDPELKQTQAGTSVLTFGMAVNDRRQNPQTGEWEDYPNFVDVVVFGGRADALGKFLVKGTKVMASGKLRYSSWEGRDGARRSKLEVVADEVDVAPRASNAGGHQGRPAAQQAPTAYPQPQMRMPAPMPRPMPQQAPTPDVYDEEIPF